MLTSCCRGSGAGLALFLAASHPCGGLREAYSAPGSREGSERGKGFFLWFLGPRAETERETEAGEAESERQRNKKRDKGVGKKRDGKGENTHQMKAFML